MADKKDEKRPIIIKKIKKVSGGHHGGAWKVAYADFVTAMMAFFLLLWLLSTSSKATLEGIAEYFTPTVGLKDSEGIGFDGGTAQMVDGSVKGSMSQPGVVVGSTQIGETPDIPENQSPVESTEEANLFREGENAIQQAFTRDTNLSKYSQNLSVEQTSDGLKVDLIDSETYPMFQPGTANLTEHGQAIMGRMAGIIKRMPNYISITGHTDGSPTESGNANFSNWELSTDRANTTRRFLQRSGLEAERTKKVTGMADKELAVPSEPRSPRNRRISIVLLRGSHILIPDAAVPVEQKQ